MKQLFYVLALCFTLISCKKEEMIPQRIANVDPGATAFEGTYQGDLYRSSLDGSGAFLYEEDKNFYIYKDLYNNYWLSQVLHVDSTAITITDSYFTYDLILKSDKPCFDGDYSTYIYSGSGNFTLPVVNIQFFVQSTDPCNRNEQWYYGSFTQL